MESEGVEETAVQEGKEMIRRRNAYFEGWMKGVCSEDKGTYRATAADEEGDRRSKCAIVLACAGTAGWKCA